MMRIDIISAVPQLLESPLNHSIVGNAQDEGLVEIYTHDLRDYTEDKHNKVDDYPYGGGAGMVLTPQPIFSCIEHLQSQRDYDEIFLRHQTERLLSRKTPTGCRPNKISFFFAVIIKASISV